MKQTTTFSIPLQYSIQSHVGSQKTCTGVYRFSFNGIENDNETYGKGDAYDFGARIYDSRLGRWMSIDRLTGKLSFVSPYKALGNNPIIFIDRDGNLEYETITLKDEKTGKSMTVRKLVSVKVMTDGKLTFHRDDEGSHMIQKYYDFETIIVRTQKTDGTIVEEKQIKIIPQNGVKEEVEIEEPKDREQNGYIKYNLSDLGALGDVMSGGVSYYSGDGGPNSTKYKSLNDVESVDLKIFLKLAGNLYGVQTSKLAEGANLLKEIVETGQEIMKDREKDQEIEKRKGPKAVCSICPGDTFPAIDSADKHTGKITVLPNKK